MYTTQEIVTNVFAFILLLLQLLVLWPWAIIKYFLPKTQKDITGEIMLITGAGSGLGRCMAIKFAEHGAIIICTDLNKGTSDETAQIIKEAGGKSYSYELDVTNRNEVYALAEKIRSAIGDVTMLVNNAGIVTGRNFLDCPDELIVKTMEVNTVAHFWTLKTFLGPMIKNNKGHVISIASIAGYLAGPTMVDYVASKFAAVGLHESLQVELFKLADNVKTTSVCPWFINTGMFDGTVSMSPLTLPILDMHETVDAIVAGVLNNDEIVFIPKILMILVALKNILPSSMNRRLNEYLKTHDQMSGFTGRHEKKKD